MYKNPFITIAIVFAIIVCFLVAGNVIIVAEKIAEITHIPFVETIIYALCIVLLIIVFVVPILKIIITPEFPKLQNSGDINERSKVKELLIKNCYYNEDGSERGPVELKNKRAELKSKMEGAETEDIEEELNCRYNNIKSVIHKYGKSVFVVTAISQSGRIDTIGMIILNYRMLSDIVKQAGFRPNTYQMYKLYVSVLTTSFFSYLTSDVISSFDFDSFFDKDSAINSLVNNFKGGGFIIKSATDGAANALMTLRIGYVALNYLKMGAKQLKDNRKEVRKSAMKDAREECKKISGSITEKVWQVINPASKTNVSTEGSVH